MFFFFFFFVVFVGMVETGKVLMMPSSIFPSHRFIMRELASELVKRGHSVTWFEYGLEKRSHTVPLPDGVKEIFIRVSTKDEEIRDLYLHRNHSIHERIWRGDFDDEAEQTNAWLASIQLCDEVLSTRRAEFDRLVEERFDTVVVDDLYNPCGILHVALQKSVFIYWSMTPLRTESVWANQSPSPPSYIPVPGTGLTDELDFWQRSYNLASYLRAIYVHQHLILRRIDAMFKKHYENVTEAFHVERNASINFVNTPPIFDFARPYMPRVNFVGALHCRKSKSLVGELKSFVEKSNEEKGFIVLSTGFTAQWKRSPMSFKKVLIESFRRHKDIQFVWQYNGESMSEMPSNVFISEWLPLQDLLDGLIFAGHDKCRAHISHGGINSVIETVWHGVPVIGIPLTARGYDNLLRLTDRKTGLMLTKNRLSVNTLSEAIDEIYKTKYKEEALIFQDMVTDVPYTELNHSAFWVEFIYRHQEVPHARSGADHLHILQYFLVDVIAFLFSCLFLTLLIVFYVVKGRSQSKAQELHTKKTN